MMRLNWILHPGVQYGLLAAGLGFCLYLFFTVKMEIGALEMRLRRRDGELDGQRAALRSALDKMAAALRETEERTGMLVAPAPTPSGLNLSKRSQALRLYRRGDSAAQIATALSLPVGEVELLIKVHSIVLEQSV